MKKKKVLYFEEERWFAKQHTVDLKGDEPFEIFVVNTPREFFEEIDGSECYDLFIMDIMTPLSLFESEDLDKLSRPQRQDLEEGLRVGIVFYEILRRNSKYKETPVIFYTAKINPNIMNTYYIPKPVTSESLIKAIKERLNILEA